MGVAACTSDAKKPVSQAPVDAPVDKPPSLPDGSGDAPPDGTACPTGQILRYESPGCGLAAKPVCGSATQHACYVPVCSCRGETISRCDYAPEPFADYGACPDAESDANLDSSGSDSGKDAPDAGIDGSIDGDRDGPAGPLDGASDGPVDASYDASPCPTGQVLRYETPGCGADAKPVCGSPQQDACFRPVCSCKGGIISRCDYATEPFVSFDRCGGDG